MPDRNLAMLADNTLCGGLGQCKSVHVLGTVASVSECRPNSMISAADQKYFLTWCTNTKVVVVVEEEG